MVAHMIVWADRTPLTLLLLLVGPGSAPHALSERVAAHHEEAAYQPLEDGGGYLEAQRRRAQGAHPARGEGAGPQSAKRLLYGHRACSRPGRHASSQAAVIKALEGGRGSLKGVDSCGQDVQ